jgi:hypothetical protein
MSYIFMLPNGTVLNVTEALYAPQADRTILMIAEESAS